jgi:hypothetical protein
MEKLTTGKEIARFLSISERHFFKMKARYEGTKYRCPVITQWTGRGRQRYMWSTKDLIFAWWYQIHNIELK